MLKNKTICLSMIVKNEEACIAKCLNYMKPYLDYWIICDTGSSDNTIQVIQETMKDIPGEVLQHEWQDFATNRNLGIEASRTKADYTLIMDADDSLIVEDSAAFDNLDKDAYRVKIKHGNLEYYRPQLIKNSIDFKYKSVLHEYIELPPCSYSILDGCYIQTSFSGARSRNPNKFLDDAKVLEAALEKEPDNARYAFYLAQSYRDSGNDLKAIENYEKRAQMTNGWIEEVFISLYEIGKAKERLKLSTYEIESSYLRAYYSLPYRAEPLCNLAKFFRLKNNFNKAYCYAKEAEKIQKPREGLFVEHDCYDWKILDEISISAYYVNQKEDGKVACEKLLAMNLPEREKERIKKNYEFYLK